MKMDNAVQIIKPDPDSQFRLLPCQCKSDNVAYILGVDAMWHVHCFDCGRNGHGSNIRHIAQVAWNEDAEQ